MACWAPSRIAGARDIDAPLDSFAVPDFDGHAAWLPQPSKTSYPPIVPSTYLLTWNPNRWTWDTLGRDARRSAEGDVVKERWSSGNTKRIVPGDRLFLMRLGVEPRGIVASGWAISETKPGPHWAPERAALGDTALYVDAEFERVLDPDVDQPLPHDDLEQRLPDFHWSPQASGIEIPSDIAVALEEAWGNRLGEAVLGRTEDPEVSAYEGQLRLLVVRHRRREQRIRVAKIEATMAAKGRLICEVPGCGFDFERRYGTTAHGFAHVHHLKPLASLEAPRLTSLADVAIVCANCHAMIHLGGECRPLEALIAEPPPAEA